MDEVRFSEDTPIQDAVIRRLTIIGEAAGNIPKEIRLQFPDVKWKSIVGLRNVVIHEYAKVKRSPDLTVGASAGSFGARNPAPNAF